MLFRCTQLVEQIESLVYHPIGAGTITVDLVDHHDGTQAQRQRLLGDKTGLRHRALDRVYQQQHAVHHAQHPFHLAAEVGVARCIDDVDMHAFIIHGAVLGQDGDTALFFQVVAVHHALGDMFIGSKRACLAQQLVHQSGLAVVNVGDDGDITELAGHGYSLAI